MTASAGRGHLSAGQNGITVKAPRMHNKRDAPPGDGQIRKAPAERNVLYFDIARESRAKPTNGEQIMNDISKRKRVPGKCALVLGLGTLVSMMATPALAGCGQYNAAMPPAQRVTPGQEGALIEAVYHPGSGQFIRVAHETNSGIEGMWSVTFVSDGIAPNPVPAGVMLDFGTVQWHDDGTEFMISGGRPPSSGDVCMGVWRQIGPFTYKLKHVALGWVSSDTPPSAGGPGPSPAQFLGPALLKEVVALDKSRDSYQGHFTIDQYNANGAVLLTHLSGTITGTRVTVD